MRKNRIEESGCAAGIFQSVCHGCLELFDIALGLKILLFLTYLALHSEF